MCGFLGILQNPLYSVMSFFAEKSNLSPLVYKLFTIPIFPPRSLHTLIYLFPQNLTCFFCKIRQLSCIRFHLYRLRFNILSIISICSVSSNEFQSLFPKIKKRAHSLLSRLFETTIMTILLRRNINNFISFLCNPLRYSLLFQTRLPPRPHAHPLFQGPRPVHRHGIRL